MSARLTKRDLAIVVSFAVVSPGAVFAVAILPKPDMPLAVVFSPSLLPDEILQQLANADARLIRMSTKNIAIIDGHAEVSRRLYSGGAWFIGNADPGGLCASRGQQTGKGMP